ncbi:MAG: heme-binding protein [Opitutales bacterium]
MKRRILKISAATAVVGLLSFFGYTTMAESYETPDYTLIESDGEGRFELREYPPMLIAEVVVEGSRTSSRGDAFRILADFIFGNNQPSESIEMTAPVTQEPAKIEMTAPVTQEGAGENQWRIAFIMPARFTLDNLPRPNDERIRIRETEPVRYAAIRFSGSGGDDNMDRHETKLRDWMDTNGHAAVGAPMYAFYNSPFVPFFLRRNEVLLKVEVPTETAAKDAEASGSDTPSAENDAADAAVTPST